MEFHFGGETKSIPVEELIGKVPELAELRTTLRDQYAAQPGATPEAAEARASASLEGIVRAALADFGSVFIGGKRALLDQILTLRQGIHDFYVSLMSATGEAPKLEEVRKKFADLRKALEDVSEPTEDLAAKAEPGDALTAEQKRIVDELSPTPPHPKAKTPVSATTQRLIDKGFQFVTSIGRWVKKFDTGHVEIEIGPDGLYRVKSFEKGATTPALEFSEFDTFADAYKNKPLSSRVMQAHHGLQDALMDSLFGARNNDFDFGYRKEEAPTIWLRDSTGESPHGRITHEFQDPGRIKDPDLSYSKIREYGVADLKAIGTPAGKIAEFLRVIDAHFAEKVLPNIKRAVDEGRLSPAEARKLIGGDLFSGIVP